MLYLKSFGTGTHFFLFDFNEIPDFENFKNSGEDLIQRRFELNFLLKEGDISNFYFQNQIGNSNFIEGVMRKDVKNCLEKFKEKDVLMRSRAKTQIFNITSKIRKRSNFF